MGYTRPFLLFFCSSLVFFSIHIRGGQFSIDTGLLPSANSNRAIAQFNLDIIDAANGVFLWMHTQSSILNKVAKGYFISNLYLP